MWKLNFKNELLHERAYLYVQEFQRDLFRAAVKIVAHWDPVKGAKLDGEVLIDETHPGPSNGPRETRA